jgi:YggT family protein
MAAITFIVRALLGLLVTVFLLRLLLPLCRADARNPLSQAVIKLTNPLVMPLRRVMPTVQRLDTASLIALLLVQLAGTALIWKLSGLPLTPGPLLFAVVRELLSVVLQLYFFVILISAVLSWVAPGTYSPGANLVNSLVAPVLRPFRRFIPPIAGLDLSALFALIAIQALQILLNS